MLTPSWADAILRACEQWKAGAIDAAALGQELLRLTAKPEVPAPVRRDAEGWCRQLEAAWQWASRGDIRGLGRVEGIVFALQGWAHGLADKPSACADPGGR
jgi:hypothetical protein